MQFVQDLEKRLESLLLDSVDKDVTDALADELDLASSGIRGGSELSDHSRSEADHEQAEEVIVLGLDVDVGLDGGLPLADQRAQLVSGHVHSVEIGEAGGSLDILDNQSDLPVCLLRALVVQLEVSQAGLEDSALQSLAGHLYIGRILEPY
mgnify:CR=1 FL=1